MTEKEERDIDILKILNKLENQISGINKQNVRISGQITEVKDEMTNFKTEIKTTLNELIQENIVLKQDVKDLGRKVTLMEKRYLKYNIVIYGIRTPENLINEILDLIRIKLEISCEFSDIRDAYVFNPKQNSPTKPILVELSRVSLKNEILKSTKKLKGSGIFISPHYSSEEYNKRKFMVSKWKATKNVHKEAKLKNNYLIIDDKTYSYEDLKKLEEEQSNDVIQHTVAAGKVDGKKQTNINTSSNQTIYANKKPSCALNLRSKIK